MVRSTSERHDHGPVLDCNLLLPWLNLLLQLLDFVIEDKLKFLKFLIFLLEIINTTLLRQKVIQISTLQR